MLLLASCVSILQALSGPAPAEFVLDELEAPPLPHLARPPRYQRLALPPGAPAEFFVHVDLAGTWHELELRRATVRGGSFRLLVDSPDGLVEAEPPPATTYTGTLDLDPRSRVSASFVDGEFEATVLDAGGNLWQVVPARRIGRALPGVHAVLAPAAKLPPATGGSSSLALGDNLIAQLGVDSEYRHTRSIGGVNPTVARIEASIAASNLRYEAQLGVRFELSTLVVRTSAQQDPYAAYEQSGNCFQLVSTSGDVWNASQAESAWDLAILFHKKPLFGITSCANKGSLCTGQGNAVIAGVDPFGDFPYGFLHEVGHVFGADDDACANPPGCTDCFIMGHCGYANTSTYYCDCEVAQLQAVVAQAQCLTTTIPDEPPTLLQPGNPTAMAPANLFPVTLHGTHLADAQYIVIDDGSGPEVHRWKTTVVNDETLTVKVPLPSALGPFSLAVGNSAGRSSYVTLQYVATDPELLIAPDTVKPNVIFSRKLYGAAGANVRLLRSNGNGSTVDQQGFQVLAQQDQVHTHVLDSIGQAQQGGLVGSQITPGTHLFCQIVAYSDATFTTITGVSNITDTLVVP